MVISETKLQQLAQSLQDYRGNGRDEVLFDTLDRGNYGGYHWNKHVQMLQEADPSGLFTRMLLAEMVEATIVGSKVKLDRVLREPYSLINWPGFRRSRARFWPRLMSLAPPYFNISVRRCTPSRRNLGMAGATVNNAARTNFMVSYLRLAQH